MVRDEERLVHACPCLTMQLTVVEKPNMQNNVSMPANSISKIDQINIVFPNA